MKAKLLLLLFIAANKLVLAQVDTTAVPFIAYWNKGETHKYQVTKIKQSWKEGNLEKNDSTVYEAKFEVIDSTETSYTIKWTYENNLISDIDPSEEVLSALGKYELTDVIYTTTETGEFIGIENWEEISTMFKDILETGFEAKNTGKNTSKKMKKNIAMLTEIYGSKSRIEQVLFKELQCFHFPFGYEYDANKTVTYTQELENVFGGASFIGDTKFYFENVDFNKKRCAFIQEMTLRPDEVMKAIKAMFKKMKLKDREFKKAMKSAVFDIKDNNRFEYLYEPGLPVLIEMERKTLMDIAAEKGESIKRLRIELIEEE